MHKQTNRLQRAFLAGVRKHGYFRPGDTVVVAVSGGKDSAALLELLASLAPNLHIGLHAAHLDHGIRGEAARRDSTAVEQHARRLGIPFHGGRARVPQRARNRGISLEMAAREARYEFLRKVCRKIGATVLATAHTMDDQAETLILKLARGAGTTGLAGIQRTSDHYGLRLVRPLLDFRGQELAAFLRARCVTWREDASNTDPAFLRNRVRAEVLPLLEQRLNPALAPALARTADILQAEDAWMQSVAEQLLQQCAASGTDSHALDAKALSAIPAAALRRVLIRWLAAQGVGESDIDYRRLDSLGRLASSRRGSGQVELPRGRRVVRQAGRLTLTDANPAPARPLPTHTLPRPGETRSLPAWGIRITVEPRTGALKPRCPGPGHLPACASINAATAGRRTIRIRPWRAGDRMRPLGMEGSRKLQDIFVDAKIPVEARNRIPLLVCGSEIVWIPGYRVARGWEVESPSAKALHIRIEPLSNESLP